MSNRIRKFDSLWKWRQRNFIDYRRTSMRFTAGRYAGTSWVRRRGYFRTAIQASRAVGDGMKTFEYFKAQPWETWTMLRPWV